MSEKQTSKNSRAILLDIIRIIFALLIFMRHAHTVGGLTWGGGFINATVLNYTGPVMTGFFALSGFSLAITYSKQELTSGAIIARFYKKRAVGILPIYFLVHFAYLIFLCDSTKDIVCLFPIEIFGIQTFFDSLFNYLHNGGTWFISCLLVC